MCGMLREHIIEVLAIGFVISVGLGTVIDIGAISSSKFLAVSKVLLRVIFVKPEVVRLIEPELLVVATFVNTMSPGYKSSYPESV